MFPTNRSQDYTPDFRSVAGELIRDLIRRDPALWARVQADEALRRDFGFEPGHERS